MNKFKEYNKLNNNDHELSKWLFDRNWNGKVIKHNVSMSDFVLDTGRTLCRLVYNNKKCTYRVFIPIKEK